MENKTLLLTIHVHVTNACSVNNGKNGVVMLPFTGTAEGEGFTGEVTGTGVDTQRIEGDRLVSLSARYMLSGRDSAGKECKIFIENNGSSLDNCTPTIVTDSEVLSHWQEAKLFSSVTPTEDEVTVRIFACTDS